MYLVYMDESGYVPRNWSSKEALDQQPFYVAAAVLIEAEKLFEIYKHIQDKLTTSGALEPKVCSLLGKGVEVKASWVERGEKVFQNVSEEKRREIAEVYLDVNATYIAAVIDKVKHKERYAHPDEPHDMAMQFVIERIAYFLKDKKASAILFIDQNSSEEESQKANLNAWFKRGISGTRRDDLGMGEEVWSVQIEDVKEVHFGDSKYSMGLQIADFLARAIYSYERGKSFFKPLWQTIETRFRDYPNHFGRGFKRFP